MLFKSTGIVFRFTRYGETSIIVTIFTSQFGLQSYIVNGVRSKSGKGKIALYQPLTLLDLVVYHKESATLSRIKEAKCLRPYRSIYRDVHKTTIALFIEEILNKSVKEESHASELCNFLVDALTTLDEMPKAENFHLVFLLKLSRHLGFQPLEVSEVVGGRVMDFGEDDALKELLQADFDTSLTLTQQQRRNLLDALLRFYSMHVENFGQVKSLAVLREILN